MLVKSVSRVGTGVTVAARSLAQAMVAHPSLGLELLGIEDQHSQEDIRDWLPIKPSLFPSYGPRAVLYAPAMLRHLLDSQPDLVHTHGLWIYTSMAARKWAHATDHPLLISPHGMLDPWAVRNSRWKKRLAGWLYENAHLRQAQCIHALCEPEAQAIRDFGLKNPISIIPNGINLPAGDPKCAPAWSAKVPEGEKVLLFLSRIHPKKNLVGLLKGWQQAGDKTQSWHIAIAGMDEGGHEQELKDLSRELGIDNQVHFIGPQFGEAKAAAYFHADAFTLPSFSEGLPMVVLEAWAYRLPALVTPECNLPDGPETGAAIETTTSPNSIAQGLEKLFSMSDSERIVMGERGRKLVEDRFTWQTVAAQMRRIYDWLLCGGTSPDTIWDS